MVALAADTAMEDKVAPETVRVPVPVMAPDAALTLAVPSFIPVASPAALTAITPPGELVHATELVMFWVLPSEYVPVAVNCCTVPSGIAAFPKVTAMDVSAAGETVNELPPAIAPDIALTVAVPILVPVASPEGLTDTRPAGELLHATELVTSWVLPSV